MPDGVSTPPTHPRIPYGEADFRRIRLNRWLYVDKTRFLRRLEEERYAYLIRPRRFGKSLRMANEGEWRPVLDFLSEAIARQTGIRDYIGGEKVIQGFLAAFLSVADYYVFRSEAELGKGHADIALEPLVARYPHLQRGYLIELSTLIAVGACSAPSALSAARRRTTPAWRRQSERRRRSSSGTWRINGWRASFRGCASSA